MLKYVISLSFYLFATLSFAQEPFSILGSKRQTFPIATSSHRSAKIYKIIALLNVHLSAKRKKSMLRRMQSSRQMHASAYDYPSQIQLGMNNVPVLDQGLHGTCVTFAITAALDALLGQGDYISQLCQLELGQYLNHNSYMQSGWNGSSSRVVFAQMEMFGIVPKAIQQSEGCAGIMAYPLYANVPDEELTVTDFHKISESIQEKDIIFRSMINFDELDDFDGEKFLLRLKKVLNQGDRIVLSSVLFDGFGVVGALGTHQVVNDTWVKTQEIIDSFNAPELSFSGHAMVLTGYDDDAVAVDSNGHFHHGLFTLRNSWGDDAGDQGNFYMSYDYLKTFVIEAYPIFALKG